MNTRDVRMLSLALKLASNKKINDTRNFRLAAVGVRNDGAIVTAVNGSVHYTGILRHRSFPKSHAEARLSRKLDVGSTVYVVRAAKTDGSATMAMPCPSCMQFLAQRGVKRIVFTMYDGKIGEILL
jgi:pyrimidine deaminase RibD-like protein